MNICKSLGAESYINAIGGKDLYSKERFTKEGINLNFIQTGDVRYKQFGNEFVPFLSIIDVLMFNSPEEARILLDDYELA